MSEESKGLIFLLLLIPIGIRYLIKTGNNDSKIGTTDYAIAAVIVAVVIATNL